MVSNIIYKAKDLFTKLNAAKKPPLKHRALKSRLKIS